MTRATAGALTALAVVLVLAGCGSGQAEPAPPPVMDETFSDLDKSGLAITVEPKSNEVVLKVRRASPRQRR